MNKKDQYTLIKQSFESVDTDALNVPMYIHTNKHTQTVTNTVITHEHIYIYIRLMHTHIRTNRCIHTYY